MKALMGMMASMVTRAGSEVYTPTSQAGAPRRTRNTLIKDIAPALDRAWNTISR
jgi:hypothetical protein